MKTSKVQILAILLIAIIFTSCADSKKFKINNEEVVVKPYGWFDLNAKNDSVNYKLSTGNIVLGVLFSGTIVVPVILTGDQLWEPVSKK